MLLPEVDAGRVHGKFREMMARYKTVSAEIGYRTTQRAGESGRDTDGAEEDTVKRYETLGNQKWAHWSRWRSIFGHCARADLSNVSETITPVKKVTTPPNSPASPVEQGKRKKRAAAAGTNEFCKPVHLNVTMHAD
jgi:hypothetical protein